MRWTAALALYVCGFAANVTHKIDVLSLIKIIARVFPKETSSNARSKSPRLVQNVGIKTRLDDALRVLKVSFLNI